MPHAAPERAGPEPGIEYSDRVNQARAPACPRCGYDLSGETEGWTERCPTAGTCPECGLGLSWREVFAIRGQWGSEVPWYSEHAPTLLSMIQRTPATIARLVFPARFFGVVNHRRAVDPLRLAYWLLCFAVALHLIVSPIGYIAHRVEGYAYDRSGTGALTRMLHTQLTEIPSAVSYPFFFVSYGSGGYTLSPGPFAGYGWSWYMRLSHAMVGATVFWIGLIAFVRLTRYEPGTDLRHDLRLLLRVVLLNALSVTVYIQFIRLGFGIHAATGMTVATIWVPVAFIVSVFVLLFWQQLICTHALRCYWHIRRSFLINVGGCFGSVAFGISYLIWML